MRCRQCGDQSEGVYIPTPHLIHEGKNVCGVCGAFLGWVKKTKNEGKRGKASKFKLWLGYCQLCRRTKDMLGKHEVLHCHHLVPIKDGGEDVRENILVVCTYCHTVIHARQTYLYDHFKDVPHE